MKLKKTPRISDPRNQTTIDLSTITNSPTCKNKNKTGNLTKMTKWINFVVDHLWSITSWPMVHNFTDHNMISHDFQIPIISIVWRCVFEFLFWFVVFSSCALSWNSLFLKNISIIYIKIGNYFIRYARPFSLEDHCINKDLNFWIWLFHWQKF